MVGNAGSVNAGPNHNNIRFVDHSGFLTRGVGQFKNPTWPLKRFTDKFSRKRNRPKAGRQQPQANTSFTTRRGVTPVSLCSRPSWK